MGDLTSDHDSAIELVIGAYRKLKKLNPEHDLLKYIKKVTSNGFDNVSKFREDYIEKFGKDQKREMGVMTNYYFALEKAADSN